MGGEEGMGGEKWWEGGGDGRRKVRTATVNRSMHTVDVRTCPPPTHTHTHSHTHTYNRNTQAHLLNEVNAWLEVKSEVNEGPLNALCFVLLLFQDEHGVVEQLL